MRPDSCKCDEFSTGYQQDEDDLDFDPMDVPDFFENPGGGVKIPMEKPLDDVYDEFKPSGTQMDPPTPDLLVRVKTKAKVVLPTSPYLRPALEIAARRGDVVTSGRDGKHLPNSLHHNGLAIDVRPAVDLAAQVFEYRSAGYKVLTEGLPDPATGKVTAITPGVGTGAHLHISFDPEGKRV